MAGPPLYILLCSGEHEKVQMAAMMASVGAVSDRPVEVFVSMGALAVFAEAVPREGRYHGGVLSRLMREKGAPDALDLFRQGRDLGELKVWACSMALDLHGWEVADLVEDLFDGALGLTSFLSRAESGQLVTL
jgi:peroxiredoxin family protein